MQHVGHLHRDAVARHQVGVGLQVTGEGRAVAFQLGVGQVTPMLLNAGRSANFLQERSNTSITDL
jgi:hypothetical protein